MASDSEAAVERRGERRSVLLLGGTGRIGTAVASHLIRPGQDASAPPLRVVLAGRSTPRGNAAVQEVVQDAGGNDAVAEGHAVEFMELDYKDAGALRGALRSGGFSAVVHTAGPFDVGVGVLAACIEEGVPAYCDVADPLEYIEEALALSEKAKASGTLALVASGAFPGLSNLLALEARAALTPGATVRDLTFSYFTAGLGGSGDVNLLITNLGFGEPVCTLKDGTERRELVAGDQTIPVDFGEGIGRVSTWAWPFPEGLTVGRHLGISGESRVAMGTAPDLWNVIMTAMVKTLPRTLWRNRAFSTGLAKFSQPLVKVTDLFVGETHAIRVDLTSEQGEEVSVLQTHESFRRCVGQSCAEFTLALLRLQASPDPPLGAVFLPEMLFDSAEQRADLVARMTTTPGTTGFSITKGERERG